MIGVWLLLMRLRCVVDCCVRVVVGVGVGVGVVCVGIGLGLGFGLCLCFCVQVRGCSSDAKKLRNVNKGQVSIES